MSFDFPSVATKKKKEKEKKAKAKARKNIETKRYCLWCFNKCHSTGCFTRNQKLFQQILQFGECAFGELPALNSW